MNSISDVLKAYSDGEYTVKGIKDPRENKLKEDYVFDENKSVSWNRNKVKEHNTKIAEEVKQRKEKITRLEKNLREDVVSAIVNEYGLTKEQAIIVEEYGFRERHSSPSDYIQGTHDDVEFALKLLKTVK